MNSLETLFLAERNIPYRIPITCEGVDDCCLGKHERLKKKFEDAGVRARYRICWFRWSDTPLPEKVMNVSHEDECTHLYLEIERNGVWNVVDATWDLGVASVFSVNEWREEGDQAVGVPVYKTLSPEESAESMCSFTPHDQEADSKKHAAFYAAFNSWLEEVRSANS